MEHQVNIAELKDRLSFYFAGVEKGDEVIVCKRNQPFARISPLPLKQNKTTLAFDQEVKVLGEITGPAIPEDYPHVESLS